MKPHAPSETLAAATGSASFANRSRKLRGGSRECEVFVGNDAGFSHLASGLGVKTLALTA